MTWIIAVGVVLWMANRIRLWVSAKKLRPVRMMKASELAQAKDNVMVLDVRSHGYYEKDTKRIHGSSRFEPYTPNEHAATLPKDREIVLYCTCVREATSANVARLLEDQGLKVSVLEGGFRAWKKAGLPVEAVPEDLKSSPCRSLADSYFMNPLMPLPVAESSSFLGSSSASFVPVTSPRLHSLAHQAVSDTAVEVCRRACNTRHRAPSGGL